jgi:hypothetical protein
MSESIFVPPDDGYTLAGRIDGIPGLFPTVDFRYRPAVPSVRLQWTEAAGLGAKERVGAEIIERNVRELRANGGDAVRLTVEQAKRLHADVFQGLLFACLGFVGPRLEEREKNSDSASG